MAITGLDHIYLETRDWEASVAHWEGLGFVFVDRWGEEGHRAGRLEAGDARVVLAEAAPGRDPAFNVFFALDDADGFAPGEGVKVISPLEATHWGTRWLRVADPDGRVHCLEEAG